MKRIENIFSHLKSARCWILVLGALIVPISQSSANQLKISNFSAYKIDTAADTITFSMDITQSNSWRNATNYDAVWLFLKYSMDGGITWSHASMAGSGTNPSGFRAPTGFEIVVPTDETGLFFERTSLGAGNLAATGARIVWDYGQDGLSDDVAKASTTVNKIFGIEMVYIPAGSFFAGDGNSSSAYRFKQGAADNDPWYIQSESSITTTNAPSDGYYYQTTGASGENGNGDIFTIPNSFPKGHQSFYLMKYELTEGQWVGFFNTLPKDQKARRDITASALGGKDSDDVVDRNTIAWDSALPSSNATTQRPSRPVTYVSWPDLAAYADWAGLRPISELEFEKAARGKDVTPMVNEFAWGSTSYNQAEAGEIYPNTNELGAETISDSSANINRNNLSWATGDGRSGGPADSQVGPLRTGIFAENSTSRLTSGAGYYGNMELSGNIAEQVVTVGRAEGRQFLGTHGDGKLSSVSGYEGNATNSDWPGIDGTDAARGVNGSVGSGYRGGDFHASSTNIFQTSDRTQAAKDPDSQGYYQRYETGQGIFHGGRVARTAP